MMQAKQGIWVEIESIVLEPGKRAPQVPTDTQGVPLKQRVKGTLLHDTKIGETGQVRTASGRVVTGVMIAVEPGYEHGFGPVIPELITVGTELRAILEEAE